MKMVGRKTVDGRTRSLASGSIDAIRSLRCLAMVVPQQAAKPLLTLNLAVDLSDFVAGLEDLVAHALMVSLAGSA